jgi:hypothetical protein
VGEGGKLRLSPSATSPYVEL